MVLRNFATLDSKVKTTAWRCIVRASEHLLNQLQDNLNDSQADDEVVDKRRQCDILKMIVYVHCSMIEAYEGEEVKTKSSTLEPDQGRGKSKKAKKPDENNDWDKNKERSIEVILKISVLPLNRLFTPPVVEEAFVE